MSLNNKDEVMASIIQALARKLPKEQLLQFVLEKVQGLTECSALGIRLLNHQADLQCEIYSGFKREIWESESLVMKTGFDCTIIIDFSRECETFGFNELLSIPIIIDERVTGAILLANNRAESFAEETVRFLETLVLLIGEGIKRYNLEADLEHLNTHDPTTKLYNRAYLNQLIEYYESNKSIPVGVILIDIDGLRRFNDSMGQQEGDLLLLRFTEALTHCFSSNTVISRIDGDGFAILLPQTNIVTLEEQCRKVKLKTVNILLKSVSLNASLGFALRNEETQTMEEVFKQAERNMARDKIHHVQSRRNDTVKILVEALKARDIITEGHSDRLKYLMLTMAKLLGFDEFLTSDLILLAEFHDIGKLGIPDYILFKDQPLTDDERLTMQRHSEIGFKIAQSASDLLPIARWILCHHENWDGSGYPMGLKGKDIPLECRILAIVDSYDAMTNDRPYRRAMLKSEAIAELMRCSGTQFDPDLVSLLLPELKLLQN